MFWAIILPIFRSTRLCVNSLWYNAPMMLPASGRPATSWVHYITSCNTQSSAPEDGQNNFPKHFELTGIINKPLLLHPVGCLYDLYQWCTVKQISDNEIYLLIKYIKSVLWRVAKRLSYIEDARCLKVKQSNKFYCWVNKSLTVYASENQGHLSSNSRNTQHVQTTFGGQPAFYWTVWDSWLTEYLVQSYCLISWDFQS